MGRSGPTALVLVGLLAIAGCGGGDSTAACDLITRADAEEILGVATRAGGPADDSTGPGSNCIWISEDSSTEPHDPVYGLVVAEGNDSEKRADFEETRDEDSRIYRVEDVDDLGDEAYYVVYTKPNNLSGKPSLPWLYVRVGDRIIDIGTHDSDERPVELAEAQTMERAAGEIAVATLTGAN